MAVRGADRFSVAAVIVVDGEHVAEGIIGEGFRGHVFPHDDSGIFSLVVDGVDAEIVDFLRFQRVEYLAGGAAGKFFQKSNAGGIHPRHRLVGDVEFPRLDVAHIFRKAAPVDDDAGFLNAFQFKTDLRTLIFRAEQAGFLFADLFPVDGDFAENLLLGAGAFPNSELDVPRGRGFFQTEYRLRAAPVRSAQFVADHTGAGADELLFVVGEQNLETSGADGVFLNRPDGCGFDQIEPFEVDDERCPQTFGAAPYAECLTIPLRASPGVKKRTVGSVGPASGLDDFRIAGKGTVGDPFEGRTGLDPLLAVRNAVGDPVRAVVVGQQSAFRRKEYSCRKEQEQKNPLSLHGVNPFGFITSYRRGICSRRGAPLCRRNREPI